MTWAIVLAALILPHPAIPGPSTQTTRDLQANVEDGLIPADWVDGVTWNIEQRMLELRVPGVSIAVFRDFEIEWAAGYGVRDANTGDPVTTDTVFQAGSISKPVAAMVALSIAKDGLLDLDTDVRTYLRSWDLPRTGHDEDRPLTFRDILSHSGSVTVHGFGGYGTFSNPPSPVEVLSGGPGVNTAPITLDGVPGRSFRYAGGGTTMAQVMMSDISGQLFPNLAQARVLEPLGMTRSTYAQPLPVDRWPNHSAGHMEDGSVQMGRFRVHPEMAAAGLWTTPSDLCQFAIALQGAIRGESEAVLDEHWANEMVTPIHSGAALGWFIDDRAGESFFQHGGSNIGFKNQLYAHRTDGYGMAVMTNGENGGQLGNEILNAIAMAYEWDGFVQPPREGQAIDRSTLDLAVGRYELNDDDIVVIREENDQLFARRLPGREVRLVRTSEPGFQFLAYGAGYTVKFDEVTSDGFEEIYLRGQGNSRYGERLLEDELQPIEELALGDPAIAIRKYRELHSEYAEDGLVADARLNQVALDLLNSGHRSTSLAIARLNIELHPKSTNSLDTLAQILWKSGDIEGAIKTYEQALRTLATEAIPDGSRRWFENEIPPILEYLRGR